jgi:hypothetical protein
MDAFVSATPQSEKWMNPNLPGHSGRGMGAGAVFESAPVVVDRHFVSSGQRDDCRIS